MPNCTFHIVDAFTAVPFTGNPCAVVTDADGIEPADMLRIARETNAPETAFVLASDKADVRVRYFMPRGEIPFAGHPTIATGHLLRELGVLKPGTARFEFAIGVLPVDIRPDRVIMTQPPAVPDTCADAGTTAQALGLQASDLREGLPCQLMRGGVSFLMVPVRELAALRRINMDRPPSKLFWRPSACRRRTCSPPKAWSLKRMCTPGLSIRTTPGKILSPDRPPGAWLPTCTRTGCVPGRASGLSRAISSTAREPESWN